MDYNSRGEIRCIGPSHLQLLGLGRGRSPGGRGISRLYKILQRYFSKFCRFLANFLRFSIKLKPKISDFSHSRPH